MMGEEKQAMIVLEEQYANNQKFISRSFEEIDAISTGFKHYVDESYEQIRHSALIRDNDNVDLGALNRAFSLLQDESSKEINRHVKTLQAMREENKSIYKNSLKVFEEE